MALRIFSKPTTLATVRLRPAPVNPGRSSTLVSLRTKTPYVPSGPKAFSMAARRRSRNSGPVSAFTIQSRMRVRNRRVAASCSRGLAFRFRINAYCVCIHSKTEGPPGSRGWSRKDRNTPNGITSPSVTASGKKCFSSPRLAALGPAMRPESSARTFCNGIKLWL